MTQCVEREVYGTTKYRDEIRKRAKDILNVVKVKQLEEKNIFTFTMRTVGWREASKEILSGEDISYRVFSSTAYFQYLRHIHRDILSKVEIEVKHDGENPSSQILRKRLKKNRKEYKSEWDKTYSEIADSSERNKILFRQYSQNSNRQSI